MSIKTLKNGPQKLLIIGPNPFISQSSPDHSPELIFHIMKSRDQTSVLLSVENTLWNFPTFKVLVHFEPDNSRKVKIHKRRIDLLEPTYKGLNVKLFTLLVRQLIYEVAETYSAMMDIKLDSLTSHTPANLAKLNGLVDSSISAFR